MKRLFSRRVAIVVAVLLFGLWLLRPAAGPLRGRVSRSISQALGRNVAIGSIHLQFLPQPGFELENLVVFDDPQFGAEPLLRAQDVTASLRLRSLLLGRVVISHLSLSDASVNVTRNAQGKWNLEDLIDRTSHTSLAPTGAPPAASAPPNFPYIEATRARINFKLGAEKTHFALTDAEFSFWQESADTWGARLQARPIRTDANLTDTGVINASGVWRRSASVRQTPVQISFQWKQAQIGQVSKLIYGSDKGWRGGGLLTGSISGTPEHLRVVADTSVADFRRQDIIGRGTLNLSAHCSGEYDAPTRAVSNVNCHAPSGSGLLELKGGVSGLLTGGRLFSASDLWCEAFNAPADAIISLLRHANSSFPEDMTAHGGVNFQLQIARANGSSPIVYRGDGSVQNLTLGNREVPAVSIGTVPLTLGSGDDPRHLLPRLRKKRIAAETGVQLDIGPVTLANGKHAPLVSGAVVTRRGYRASLDGESGLKRLLQIARAFRIPSPAVAADGLVDVKLSISGAWGSSEFPLVEGSGQLRQVRAQIRGLNAPIEILTANLAVGANIVKVDKLSARAADTVWQGSMQITRPCPAPSACPLQFHLHTRELNANALNNLVNPAQHSGPWYRFLSLGGSQAPYLLQARASGTIKVDKLKVGAAWFQQFASELRLDRGNVSLSGFHAELLNGTVAGDWKADFAAKPPRYSGTGKFSDVSLAQVGEWNHNVWVDATGSAKYEFKASGAAFPGVLASADLSADFSLANGSFPHVVLSATSGPLHAESFAGSLRVRDGSISFHNARLVTATDVYTVNGTASLAGSLNLKALAQNATGFSITGTLLQTRVAPIPATEAVLKP